MRIFNNCMQYVLKYNPSTDSLRTGQNLSARAWLKTDLDVSLAKLDRKNLFFIFSASNKTSYRLLLKLIMIIAYLSYRLTDNDLPSQNGQPK